MADVMALHLTTLQKSILEKLFKLFMRRPILNKKLELPAVYAAVVREGLPVKKHGFSSLYDMYNLLDVFDSPDGEAVSLSRSKVLELLLRPICHLSGDTLLSSFEELNGFNPKKLCTFYNVSSLDELIKEVKELPEPLNTPSVLFKKESETASSHHVSTSSALSSGSNLYSTSQKSIIKELMQLFRKKPVIDDKSELPKIYAALIKKQGLPIKKYGYKAGLSALLNLPIFEFGVNGKEICMSRPKLLEFLLKPICHVPDEQLTSEFEKVNGFKASELCVFCQVSSINDLINEIEKPSPTSMYNTSTSIPVPYSQPCHISKKPLLYPPPSYQYPSIPLIPASPLPLRPNLGHAASVHPSMTSQCLQSQPIYVPQPAPPHLKIPSPVKTFAPLDLPASNHYPDSDVHPRDIIYLPPIDDKPSSTNISRSDITQPPVRPSFKRKETKVHLLEMIETYLKSFVDYLSCQGKHFPLLVLEEQARDIISNARRQSNIRVDIKEVPFVNNFDRLYKRIGEFIRVFCWHSPITTLFELQRTLCEFEKVKEFGELKMGPLVKHPEVIRMFKVPEDIDSVPEITAYDIHHRLMRFISKKKKGQRPDLEDFMEFLVNEFSVSSSHHLCVRISSFPLACSINYKFRTSQKLIKERMENDFEKKTEEHLDFEIQKWKQNLSRMSNNSKELGNKDPVQLIEDVFKLCLNLFQYKMHSRLLSLFDTITNNATYRKLLLIALYQGVYGVQKMIFEETHNTAPSLKTASPNFIIYKSKSELTFELGEVLKCLSFPVNLQALADAEQHLTKTLGSQYFHSFGQGSFLQFLATNDSLQRILGGNIIGCTEEAFDSVNEKRKQVISCIHQLKIYSNEEVAHVLMNQFKVGSPGQLGCGALEKMISDAQEQSPSSSFVRYLSPIVFYSDDLLPSCGILGQQTRQDALRCLQSAPLLANLFVWSNWELVYQPTCGSLHEFLRLQQSDTQPVFVLEVSPFELIKINPNPTLQDFTAAVDELNAVHAAGNLVSFAVKTNHVSNVSTDLYAQHVNSKLSKVLAKNGSKLICDFVFHSLILMPLALAATIGKKVFLDPLRKVLSSLAVDKLLSFCSTDEQRCFLQVLGMKIGIKAWADDFMEKQKTSQKEFDQKLHTVSEKVLLDPAPAVTLNIATSLATSLLDSKETITTKEQSDYSSSAKKLPKVEKNEFMETGKCKSIIASICKDEFGIGLEEELNEKQKLIVERQKEREGRSLKRLSQELYSKDTHFVLELVQNADDNSYPEHLFLNSPTLKFILSRDCITVLNNETGFSEKNIRAICDVGKSTKDRNSSGYIGQKGIGFKSVFRITEQPEIHSGGFHIKFDIHSGGPIGYILPQWVDKSYNEGKLNQEDVEKWTTRIVLPLKADSLLSLNLFQDIQPSLLLFLNRLRCIIIEDKETETIYEMKRQDYPGGIIELQHDNIMNKWLVVRKILHGASKYKTEVTATEIALAFPLPQSLKDPPLARELVSQQVFAFLPLRSYGFRFIVQGDFDLPSSREDVNTNSAWNQWLRENLPDLFIESFEAFKAIPDITELEAIVIILQFIPLEGEVHDFFQPVSTEILRVLQGKDCLPTNPFNYASVPIDPMKEIVSLVTNNTVNNEKSIVQWKQPSQLLLVHQELILDCIPQSLLASALKLYYLNTEITISLSSELCSQLNIEKVNIDHLIAVAEFVLADYHRQSSNFNVENYLPSDDEEDDETSCEVDLFGCLILWIARWLACVQCLIEEIRSFSVKSLNNLKKLQIIPLSNGELVSVDSGPIFFPSESKDLDHLFQPIYNELRIVDMRLLDAGSDSLMCARVNKILSNHLGVKELNLVGIVYDHVIPQFSLKEIEAKKDDILVLYLVLVKYAIDKGLVDRSKVISDLKQNILLVTNRGKHRPNKAFIHFSSEYCKEWILSTMFPDIQWIEVSPKYCKMSKKSKNMISSNWYELFIGLGVQVGLAIKRIDHQIDPNFDEEKFIWNCTNFKRSPDGCYSIHDYTCSEFKLIVSSVENCTSTIKIGRMKQLVNMLDHSWESTYKNYITAVYYDGAGKHELGKVISSFGYELANTAWLPAIVGAAGNKPSLQSLCKGCEIYHNSEKMRNLLHCHVPYLDAAKLQSSFLKHLQVKQDITAKELLDLLCTWSKKPSFSTSITHMIRVYEYLSRHVDESNNVISSFREKELIFVPDITQWRGKASTHLDSIGTFVSLDKAVWSDKTTVLFTSLIKQNPYPSHIPQVLSFFYGNSDDTKDRIKSAFRILMVEKDLNLQMLISLLEYNASLSSSPKVSQIESFRSIVEVVVKIIHNDYETYQNFFVNRIKHLPIFPAKSSKWVSMNELYIDDHLEEESRHFTDKVHFLDWPKIETNKNVLNDFIAICGLPQVSKSIVKTLVPGAIREFIDIRISFHYMVPLLQKYIVRLTHSQPLPAEYHQQVAQTLNHLQFYSTLELTCNFSLNDKYFANAQVKQCQLNYDNSKPIIYIVVNTESKIIDKTSLVPIIYQIIEAERVPHSDKMKSFIQELLVNDPRSEEDQKLLADKHHLQDLPSELDQWSVALPLTSSVFQKANEEPPETLEEMNTIDSLSDQVAVPSNEGSTLKAWPPKAPVIPTKKEQSFSSRVKPSNEQDRKVTSRDVITSADVKKMIEKGEQTSQPSHTGTRDKKSSNENKLHSVPLETPAQSVSHNTTPDKSSLKPSSASQNLASVKNDESPAGSKLTSKKSLPPTSVPVPKFANLTSVDIASLMQTLPIIYDGALLSFSKNEKVENLNTGKWGEKFAYILLKNQGKLPNDVPIKSIYWLNEISESGEPYDIKVISEDNTEYYIEVKSTQSLDKSLIPISWRELEFARLYKSTHILIRVYGAGTTQENVSIKWLADICTHIKNNPSVTLYLRI